MSCQQLAKKVSYFMDESPGGQNMAAYRLIRRK